MVENCLKRSLLCVKTSYENKCAYNNLQIFVVWDEATSNYGQSLICDNEKQQNYAP